MKRIFAFDIARAFAILGMMIVNYNIVFSYGKVEITFLSNFISVFEGRAAAVFLILAGIGLSLMTKKIFENEDNIFYYKKVILKRSLFLFIIGLILYIIFEWTADILHLYGIYLFFMSFMFYKSNKELKFYLFLIVLITIFLQVNFDYSYGWNSDFTSYYNFFTLDGFIANSFFNGYHPFFPWIIFIIVGVLMGRIDFSDSIKIKKIFLYSILMAIIFEFLSFFIINFFNNSELIVYFFDTKPMNPSIFYVLTASMWAIAFILFCNMIDFKSLKKFLVPTGQMALTHYVFHCIGVLSFFFFYDDLSYKNELFVIILSIVVFIIMNIFSYFWIKRFKRGPLELLMRKITS
ncbi:DUF418 domain-containing protein [Oceanotoga sp. DSM 15011]|uniref:DUF418 domain-containing protein n=1 Tax=Oceanotoga sp. DSM 15011 TaxID=2984951 RepID=UPI0021F3D1AD|nr:DUF418 domain-containing protein [Oceanotoga sp. DSM 15011]UYO99013.1 DUF418 domain-containing protein [Oceanotoga sp. DSM 15011]